MSKLKIIREIKMDKFYRRMRLLSGAEAYHRRLLSRSVYPNHDTSTALSTGFDKINKILKINHLYNPENLNKTCAERRSLSVVEMSRSIKVQTQSVTNNK